MGETKTIATIVYFVFLVLGLIWGLIRGNSENSKLKYAAQQIIVETDENENVHLVYYCSGEPFASYSADSNALQFSPGAFGSISILKTSDPESPFTLNTLTTLMGGAFGGYTIKDLYKYSKASKTKLFFKKSITIIISAITGFGVGYGAGVIFKNKTRKCDSERIIESLSSKEFWYKLEVMIFRNAIYNISINNEGSKKTIPVDFQHEVNRIYNSTQKYIDINSNSFALSQQAFQKKIEYLDSRKWYQKTLGLMVIVVVAGTIVTGLGVYLLVKFF